jgi:hypothetical protein
MLLGVHAIWGSTSAPTAQHQRRSPRTAGDRTGKHNRRFISALVERFHLSATCFCTSSPGMAERLSPSLGHATVRNRVPPPDDGDVTRWDLSRKDRLMDAHLSSHHRDTIAKIFGHPASGNIEWRQVLSLLENIGTTTEERNGKFKVALGPETEVLERPRGKDINEQLIVDLRRILRQAGFAPDGGASTPDERDRDHGDAQWGAPT